MGVWAGVASQSMRLGCLGWSLKSKKPLMRGVSMQLVQLLFRTFYKHVCPLSEKTLMRGINSM